nr:ribonuclease H-like domain-containing protein [Tanacetum cinerariifolium]
MNEVSREGYLEDAAKSNLVEDLKANKNVGIGRQFNGLYLFDVDSSCKKFVSNNYISSCFVSKTLWHQRFGHPADQVLDVLKTTLNLDSQADWVYMLKGKDDVYDSINTYVYTPQQNGIAERKHRHLLNVARSLMFQGELPLSLWSECIMTAVYLINKTRSSMLSDKSPYFCVYGHDPSLSYLKVFGCLCYATVLNNHDKFSNRPNDEGRVSSNDDGSELSPDENQGKVKYDVEKVVNHANLNSANFCFISALNKSVEPTCYEEAILDSIWIDGFANKENENKVCKLVKSFYGLKQAPRKWNKKIVSILKENDFVQSTNDHSLLTKSKNNKFIALLVYVDDIVVTGNCVDEINKFKTILLEKLLGKLIFLTHTRPDIAYSVHCLAQYMHFPLKSHLNSALNVLRYLKGAPGKSIRYRYPVDKGSLCGYSDADWAKYLKTRKCHWLLCIF